MSIRPTGRLGAVAFAVAVAFTAMTPPPVEVSGEPRTDAVARVVWEGGTIAPGQFDEFEVSLGPLPDDADQLVFKAKQTYSSGEVVDWIEERIGGADEPEHPAPVLTLVAADEDDAAPAAADDDAADDEAEDEDDDGALAPIALVVGAAGVVLAAVALARTRSSTKA